MQVDCIVFNQFMSYDDKISGESGSCQWIEGHKTKESVTMVAFKKSMRKLKIDLSCHTETSCSSTSPRSIGHHFEVSSNLLIPRFACDSV